ncbi:MAG: hypothetical protein OEY24_03960 [Candidatus Bathyarchaeota archaeon]|nr:hypothetical protein [Candidatus Bathyarchaeota archaeon]MDH5494838.1 hypothetical protein [Candidatus Bathyarchaeota archaeon]
MKLNQKGFITIIIVLIFLVILVSAVYLASQAFQTKPPIQIHRFEANPSEFKSSQIGALYFKVESFVEDDFITIAMHLETHKNVEIYLGDNLLPLEGGNYTYTKVLSPKEISSLMFRLEATVDIGDNRRDYRVKAYIYLNGNLFTIKIAPFSVCADD